MGGGVAVLLAVLLHCCRKHIDTIFFVCIFAFNISHNTDLKDVTFWETPNF